MSNSKFNRHQQHGKCEVCGKEGPVVVCSSTLGPFSFAYCEDCLHAGAEPYWFTVNAVALCGLWPDDVNEAFQEKIRSVLKYLNRSEEVFKADVETACEEMSIQGE